jgi:general secretion pathway protein C
MLRGLLIRQVFVIVDLALAVLVAVVAYLIIVKVFDADASLAGDEVLAKQPDPGQVAFWRVKPRADYQDIVANELFGEAGKRSRRSNLAPPPPEPPKEEVDTLAPLILRGTTVAGPGDRFASAVIENERDRLADTYYIEDEVLPQLVLQEVQKRKVILLNKAKNQREVLRMDEEDAQAHTPATGRQEPGGSQKVALNTVDIQQDLADISMNLDEWMDNVQPELYVDRSGEVAGITAQSISRDPLARKLGLQDGDVVQTVNGIKIDSQFKVLEILNKHQDLRTWRVGILRNGKTSMMTYTLE